MSLPFLRLSNQTTIPLLGLGTYRLTGAACTEVVRRALDLGYTHLDTAHYYQNHTAIAKALKNYDRSRLYLTSKVWPDELHKHQLIKACERALKELETDYLDLYLIHWPNPAIPIQESLEALQTLQQQGKIRSLGVSNFTLPLLQEALGFSQALVMNQVELHPYLPSKALLDFCYAQKIALTAYRPLVLGQISSDTLLNAIGHKHHKTACQVALRWLIQKQVVAIPKATSETHLKENLAIFDFTLTDQEMQAIDQLAPS